MKIKINKDALNKALTFLYPGIPSKAIQAAAEWVLFEIKGDKCTIRISNAACEMTAFVRSESDGDCEFACPLHRVHRTVSNFPDGEVNITTKDNDLGFIGSIELRPQGQRKKYKIACFPAADMFKWKTDEDRVVKDLKVPMREFYEKMKIVSNNVQANNPVMSFANITLFRNDKGNLSLLTGDSLIIGKMDLPAEIPKSFIVDRTIAKLVSGLNDDGECTIEISDSNFYLNYAGLSLACKMIDTKIPGYQKLFDNEPEKKFTVTKEDIMKSLTRIAAYNDDTNKVNIQIIEGNSLRIYANDGNNEAEEIIDILNDHDVELNVNMSHVLLRQAMGSIKADAVEIGISNGKHQVFLNPAAGNKENQTWMFAPFGKK
jgi:DNA polymerase-3 subunit beta